MASVVASNDLRGKKRPADDELEGEQRLTKKLGRLHIGNPQYESNTAQQKHPRSGSVRDTDAMHLDDTKDTIYVHDLDREFEEIESQEPKIEFLPEIEKRLMGVPKSVLQDKPSDNNALVLYKVPTSLTVPEDQDNVRRAIIEARTRAREKKAIEQPVFETNGSSNGSSPLQASESQAYPYAADSMDVD